MQSDNQSYNNMLNLLNNLYFTDRPAEELDLRFLSDDWWLSDTAVIESVSKRKGSWEIHLTFVYYLQPCRFIRRFIRTVFHAGKVEMIASFMRRAAAKDQRGTLEIHLHQFGFCDN
jgi:hypothetical protein